jgi:hypothetical protein
VMVSEWVLTNINRFPSCLTFASHWKSGVMALGRLLPAFRERVAMRSCWNEDQIVSSGQCKHTTHSGAVTTEMFCERGSDYIRGVLGPEATPRQEDSKQWEVVAM